MNEFEVRPYILRISWGPTARLGCAWPLETGSSARRIPVMSPAHLKQVYQVYRIRCAETIHRVAVHRFGGGDCSKPNTSCESHIPGAAKGMALLSGCNVIGLEFCWTL
jgi:hypothetical protein